MSEWDDDVYADDCEFHRDGRCTLDGTECDPDDVPCIWASILEDEEAEC